MARIDASVAGGFDWLKAPGALESYVSTRLAQYGQVLTVHVSVALFSSRYTATVSFIPSTGLTTEQARSAVAEAFTEWNGIAANVAITSAGEAPQQQPASAFDPFTDATTALITLAALVAVVVIVREMR